MSHLQRNFLFLAGVIVILIFSLYASLFTSPFLGPLILGNTDNFLLKIIVVIALPLVFYSSTLIYFWGRMIGVPTKTNDQSLLRVLMYLGIVGLVVYIAVTRLLY